MVYTYTFEMTIAIIAYFAVQLSNEEDIGSMVLVALLTMYNGKSNKLGQ